MTNCVFCGKKLEFNAYFYWKCKNHKNPINYRFPNDKLDMIYAYDFYYYVYSGELRIMYKTNLENVELSRLVKVLQMYSVFS